jgi:hypothetical protein
MAVAVATAAVAAVAAVAAAVVLRAVLFPGTLEQPWRK